MAWFVIIGLIALVYAGIHVANMAGAFKVSSPEQYVRDQFGNITTKPATELNFGPKVVGIATLVLGVLAGIITLFSSYTQVPAGHVGVVYQFSDIVGEIDSGGQFKAPWRSVKKVNVQEQRVWFRDPDEKEDKDKFMGRIDAASMETQNVYMDVTVNWRPDRGHVRDLYRNIGPNYFQTLVTSRVRELMKNETVKYTAIEITQKRAALGDSVVKALNGELTPYGITIVSLQIDNLWYSGEFDKAIEEKQVATQQALRAEEQVKQREAEARQAAAKAKGEADARIEAARGEAEATRVNAEAQAKANLLLSQSITPNLLQYRAIDKMNGQTLIVPAGSNFLLDPTSLLRKP